jgi:hypothetical protein
MNVEVVRFAEGALAPPTVICFCHRPNLNKVTNKCYFSKKRDGYVLEILTFKRVGVGDFFSRGEDLWNRAIKGQKIRPR